MSRKVVVAALLSLACGASALAREGFGFTKKAAEMNVTVPPAINVAGTRVALNVKGGEARAA